MDEISSVTFCDSDFHYIITLSGLKFYTGKKKEKKEEGQTVRG